MTNLKYQESELYPILFYEPETGTFEDPPGRAKVDKIRKPVPGDPKLNVLQYIKIACVFCS